MTISTRLFNEQTIRSIAVLNDRVIGLQEQVSTGKVDLRPSQDLVAAVRRSAGTEILDRIERYRANLDATRNRLDLADDVLGQVTSSVTRLQELAIQAANDTLGPVDRAAIGTEVSQLRGLLLGLANTRDSQGQALFGGYRTNSEPFVPAADGAIVYRGDAGTHVLNVSDTRTLATGIDGQTAFLRIDTPDGPMPLFDMVDRFQAALGAPDSGSSQAETLSAMVGLMGGAVDHFALQRAQIGSLGNAANAHAEVLDSRALLLRKSMSGLEDADMAEVITQLQGLLANREATQQVFARIGQQSLFDFIR
jgi:flagellar hook-associated protein 3 FlgL